MGGALLGNSHCQNITGSAMQDRITCRPKNKRQSVTTMAAYNNKVDVIFFGHIVHFLCRVAKNNMLVFLTDINLRG